MTAPKTLLELAGADLNLPRLRDACLVLIDLQIRISRRVRSRCPMRGARSPTPQGCWRGRAPHGTRDLPHRPQGPARRIVRSQRPNAAPSSPSWRRSQGEAVIEKGLPNAFAGTDLQAQLAATGRKNIILAGFMTHMCISSTARAGLDLGFRITVDANSCATRDLPDGRGGSVPAATIHDVALVELSDRFAIIARGDDALV